MLHFFLKTGKEHLGEIVAGLRHMNLAGFGVTKLDKVAMPYLDELEPTCQDMVLYQGAAQVKLWTGWEAHINAIRRELEQIILREGK